MNINVDPENQLNVTLNVLSDYDSLKQQYIGADWIVNF